MTFISFISCILAVLIPSFFLLSVYNIVTKKNLIKKYGMADGLFSLFILQGILILPLFVMRHIESFLLSF